MSGLVDDVMDIAHARLGGIELDRAEVDVDALVRRVVAAHVDSFGRSTRDPGVSIDVTSDGNLRARVDARRVEQLVTTMIGSVLERSPSGTQVTVTLVGKDTDLTMRVHNSAATTQQPIVASLKPRLLRPFARRPSGGTPENAMTRDASSASMRTMVRKMMRATSGAATILPATRRRLELFVVAKIAQAHGGRIELRSDHEGTTFALMMPRMM